MLYEEGLRSSRKKPGTIPKRQSVLRAEFKGGREFGSETIPVPFTSPLLPPSRRQKSAAQKELTLSECHSCQEQNPICSHISVTDTIVEAALLRPRSPHPEYIG